MDCGTYIEKYLTAHADGELVGEEKYAADTHVAGCDTCRARLEEERALKALVRDRGILRAPSPIRIALRAALDNADDAARERVVSWARTGSAIRRTARYWAPAAAAAAAIFAIVLTRNINSGPPSAHPEFDAIVDHYERFANRFEPNVSSRSAAEISEAYMGHQMPGFLWNFGPSGYQLLGGRVEKLYDGRDITYTVYHGERANIMCSYLRAPGLSPPPGAEVREIGGRIYFRYRGHTLSMSFHPNGSMLCILTSSLTIAQFARDIADSAI